MLKPFAFLIGAFGLIACAHSNAGNATTTNADMKPITADDVQNAILETRPGEAEEIYALIITNDNGVITVRGKVEDESTHSEVIARAKAMKNVKGVVDKVHVVPKPNSKKVDL